MSDPNLDLATIEHSDMPEERVKARERIERKVAALEADLAAARRERDALALQLAHEWGWPDGDSVLVRLQGDRTAMLTTFSEDAALVFLAALATEEPQP